MIFTQRQAREKIQTLESRISELESESASKDETIQSLQTEISEASANAAPQSARVLELEEEVLALGGQIETLQSSVSAKDAEIAKLAASAKITENKVNAAAVATLATIGQEAPLAVESGAPAVDNKMDIATFNSLEIHERNKFIREGGKLK